MAIAGKPSWVMGLGGGSSEDAWGVAEWRFVRGAGFSERGSRRPHVQPYFTS